MIGWVLGILCGGVVAILGGPWMFLGFLIGATIVSILLSRG